MTDFVNTEIPRDGYGRPLVIPPNTHSHALTPLTKRVAYQRTTTFVSALEDQNGLIRWKGQKIVYGMGQRKDLVLAAAATDPEDKKQLGKLAEYACEYALSSASATTGTALHALTERVDRGQPLGSIPTEYEADIAAYELATELIKWEGIEAFRVYDDWKVAGTADRLGRDNGRLRVYDVKTGSIDYPHKMAMQLAMYARSLPYDIATDTRGPHEDIDLNTGVIIHLPAGQGRCDLYEIDIAKGWGACLLAKKVWDWRKTKDLTRLIDPDEPPTQPPTWDLLARNASTVADLRLIWTRARECGQLTDDLKSLLTQRYNTIRGAA